MGTIIKIFLNMKFLMKILSVAGIVAAGFDDQPNPPTWDPSVVYFPQAADATARAAQ